MKKVISVNPYVKMAGQFPGRLILGQPAQISEQLQILATKHKNFALEIGSGSGAHLISRAESYPEMGFIGVELRFKRAVRTIEKAQARGVSNIYIVRENIENVWKGLSQLKFKSVFVNFPDPWPRRKSWKHRLLSRNQLQILDSLLVENGSLELKTDHPQYFEWVKSEILHSKLFGVSEESSDLYGQLEWQAAKYKSEFEQLFFHKKIKINYLKAGVLSR